MVYSVRLTAAQKAAAKLPITVHRGVRAEATACEIAQVFDVPVAGKDPPQGIRGEEFPIMYAAGGRYLPDLRQDGVVVTPEILQRHRQRRDEILTKALTMPDLEAETIETVFKVPEKKEPSLYARRSRLRTVYVQKAPKRWGRK